MEKIKTIAATKEARSSEMSDRGRFVANFMNLFFKKIPISLKMNVFFEMLMKNHEE